MIKGIIPVALLLTSFVANAQLQEGKKNIENLCGCFNVSFKYAETFSPDTAYKYHGREELGALELALPIENSDKKIVIQHLLVVGDSMIIKHWREDWTYEPTSLFKYQGDKKWVKQPIAAADAKGKWAQTVWEVDDAPRYQGLSEWVKTDGKTFWQNTTNAPLPRREYTQRNDYNILRRGNRLILNDSGYIHDQDNDKILSKNNSEKEIAEEKGLNIYKKTKDSECAYAKAWWQQHEKFWVVVRQSWNEILNEKNNIQLQGKVDGKYLYQLLDVVETQNNSNNVAVKEKIKESINKYLQSIATKEVATNNYELQITN